VERTRKEGNVKKVEEEYLGISFMINFKKKKRISRGSETENKN